MNSNNILYPIVPCNELFIPIEQDISQQQDEINLNIENNLHHNNLTNITDQNQYNTQPLLIKEITKILSYDVIKDQYNISKIYTSRTVERLISSWYLYDGSLITFQNNNHNMFINILPLDTIIELLSYLPLINIHQLCMVSKMFSFPQVYKLLKIEKTNKHFYMFYIIFSSLSLSVYIYNLYICLKL